MWSRRSRWFRWSRCSKWSDGPGYQCVQGGQSGQLGWSGWSDMEFVKYFTPVSFPKFSILPKKRVNCDIFGKTCECRMLYSYFLRKNAIFFVNFFSKTKSLHLFCEKVKPEFGKFHKKFHVNSLKLFIIQIPCLRVVQVAQVAQVETKGKWKVEQYSA